MVYDPRPCAPDSQEGRTSKMTKKNIQTKAGKVLRDDDAHEQARSLAGSALSGGNNSHGIVSAAIEKKARNTAEDDAMHLAGHIVKNNKEKVRSILYHNES